MDHNDLAAYERRRARERAAERYTPSRNYAPGNHRGPNRRDKGQEGKACNVTACQLPNSAHWFNHSTRAWYCETCARELNRANADYREMFKADHDLCTLGRGND